MADQNNTIRTTVALDVNSAQREIVKLNAAASDSTKSLEDRVAAKNKQVEIQNQLSKQTIDLLDKEIKELEEAGAAEKDITKAKQRLNRETLKATKVSENNAKAQNKLGKALTDSRSATKNLDKATGGLLTRLKLLATNPIVLVITALVGAFQLLRKALASSEEGQNKLQKALSVIGSIFNNLLDVVSVFANVLFDAITKPGEAWDSFVATIRSGYEFIKGQIIDRFIANFNILSGVFQKGVLLMRIAWNNFTGDSEEAQQLTEELDAVNKKIEDSVKLIKKRNQEIVDVFVDAKDAVTGFIEELEREARIAAQIADMRAQADRVQRDLIVQRAEADRRRFDLLEKAADRENFTAEQRVKFLREAGRVNQEITDREIERARLLLIAKQQENALANSTKEDLEEEAKLKAELINLETRRIKAQRTITSQIVTALREARAEEAASLKEKEQLRQRDFDAEIELEELRIERLKQQGEQTLEIELDLLNRKMEAELANEELLESEKDLIRARFAIMAEERRDEELEKELETIRTRNELLLELDELEIERLRAKGERTLELELAVLEKRRQQEVSVAGLTAEEIAVINKRAENEKQKLRDASEKAEKEKNKAELESTINSAAEAFGIAQEVALAELLIKAPEAIGNSFERASARYAPPFSLIMGALGAAGSIAPIIKGISQIKNTRFSKSRGGAPAGGGNVSASVGGSPGSAAVPASASASITPELISDVSANNASRLGLDTNIGDAATATAANNVTGTSGGRVVFSENRYTDFQRQVDFKEDKTSI
jgi:hypothetical protein